MHQIGQVNEQPLHAALNTHYAHPNAQTEVLVDGYLVDVCFQASAISWLYQRVKLPYWLTWQVLLPCSSGCSLAAVM